MVSGRKYRLTSVIMSIHAPIEFRKFPAAVTMPNDFNRAQPRRKIDYHTRQRDVVEITR